MLISAENAEFEGAACPGRERSGSGGWAVQCALHFGLVYVDVDNECGQGGGEKASTVLSEAFWDCARGERRVIRTGQVSVVRRVGGTGSTRCVWRIRYGRICQSESVRKLDVEGVHCTDVRAIAIFHIKRDD